MKTSNDKYIQTSLFSDEDTIIDNKCKKLEQTTRDVAKYVQKCPHVQGNHNCVYNLSEDPNCVICQISTMNKNSSVARIEPNTEACGTYKCAYYIKK